MGHIQHEIDEAKKKRRTATIVCGLLGLLGGWFMFEDDRCVLACFGCALLAWIVRSFEVITWEKIQQPGGKGWRSSDTNSNEKER